MSQAGILKVAKQILPPTVPLQFTTDSGTAVPAANNLNVFGSTVAAGSIPFRSIGSGSTVTYQTQISQAIGATDATKIGLSAFSSSQFSVDANGFVTLTGGSGPAIQTINGDSGSITGSTVTIFANQATNNAGQSVLFVNSGTVSTLNVTDASFNTFIGKGSGKAGVTGTFNTGLGYNSLNAITSGLANVAVGFEALLSNTSGTGNVAVGEVALLTNTTSSGNTAIGESALHTVQTGSGNNTAVGVNSLTGVTGAFNTAIGAATGTALGAASYSTLIGYLAGSAYTSTESSNILIMNSGVISESNVLRIGTQGAGNGQVNAAYIAGIVGVTTSNSQMVTIDSTSGHLGVAAIPSGAVVWSDKSGNFNAATLNGYFCTAALTATLPASPSEGDTISFICTTTAIVIQANTGQVIALGSVSSTSAGTATNIATGDAITLVYRATSTTWRALNSVGSWTLA